MTEIRLSVALVTRNHPDSLKRCLESLRAQNVQPVEVVISDDSDPAWVDETRSVAKQWDGCYVTGPRRGLYANRNHAAIICQGTHIRTMDDDHVFPAGHFEQCLTAVARDPRAIWTTGEAGFIDGKFYGKLDTATQLHPSGVGGPVADPDDNWAIADGSTIYPREIFARGLRMFEDFRYGSSYLEFGAYMYHRGFRSRSVPGALVEHYAEAATLNRDADIEVWSSRLFASVCFNLYFQRSLSLAARYLCSYLLLRGPTFAKFRSVPGILQKAKARWK